MGARLDQHLQRRRNPPGVGVGVGSRLRPLALADGAGLAVQHVGGDRPGRAAEADQRPLRLQGRSHPAERTAHRRQMLAGRGRQRGHLIRLRHAAEPRTLARLEPHLLAQGAGDQQDVGEDDGGVEAEPPHRLQRRLRRHVGVQAKGDEVRRLGAQSPVLGQIAPRLPHEPDRRPIQRLALQGSEQQRRGRRRRGHGRKAYGPHLPCSIPNQKKN